MFNKDELLFYIQANINAYGGRYGEVIPVFDRVERYSNKQADMEIGYLSDEIYFIFPGSVGLRDWVDDFRRRKVLFSDFCYAKVHSGFLYQYNLLRSKIFDASASFSKINFTGFSMGAAISTLAAYEIKNFYRHKTIKHINFGSPRVGNATFAHYFNAFLPKSVRVKNGKDIVTRVPVLGYVHVGQELAIDGGNGPLLSHHPASYKNGLLNLTEA